MDRTIKMIVAATNSHGKPDLYLCEVSCPQEQIDTGEHYELAKELAKNDGFQPYLAFDEYDTDENIFLHAHNWINSKDSSY